MIDHLSFSSIKLFMDCQMKWKFHYIDNLPRFENEAMLFGKKIHEALSHYFTTKISLYNSWEIVASELPSHLYQRGVNLSVNHNLINYIKTLPVIYSEKGFEFTFSDVPIVGAIDAILQDGTIIDFKISKGFNKSHYWLQPLVYLKGLAESNIPINNTFKFIVIHPVNINISVYTYTTDNYEIYLNYILEGVIKDIKDSINKNSFEVTNDETQCKFCQYKTICPKWREEL